MGKDDIAVEKRVSVVGKLGFALEERDSAVEGGLEIVVFPKSAVGEKGLAVEKGGVAVWKTALLTKK